MNVNFKLKQRGWSHREMQLQNLWFNIKLRDWSLKFEKGMGPMKIWTKLEYLKRFKNTLAQKLRLIGIHTDTRTNYVIK